MSKKEIIYLAKKAGIDIPKGLEDREAIYYIADQLNIPEFQYTEEGLSRLVEEFDVVFPYETLEEDSLNDVGTDTDTSLTQEGDSAFPVMKKEDKEEQPTSKEIPSSNDVSSLPREETQMPEQQKNSSLPKDSGLSNSSESPKENEKENSSLNGKDKENFASNEQNGDEPDKKNSPSLNQANRRGGNSPLNKEGDGTQYANSNYQHQKRVADGKKKEEEEPNKSNKKKSGKDDKEKKKDPSSKKENTSNTRGGKVFNRLQEESPFPFGNLKNKTLQFLVTHPGLSIILLVFLLFIFIILFVAIDEDGKGGKAGTRCNYELKGVVETGSVSLNDVQVELINCDGTPDNYTVLGTVDFEKYVVGVALAEIGSSSPDEAIKAQIVAARNFALTRNSGMCPGSPSTCFYGYNLSTNKIRMRACEADQVYWDYTQNIYRQDRGSISLYSPEVDASSGSLWQSALSEERIAQINSLAEDVRGVVLLDQEDYVLKTTYNAAVSKQFQSEASAGKSYEEILSNQYGSSNFNTSVCSSYGFIDYGDYVLDSTGHEILHQDLSSFLNSKGTSLEEFNTLIADNVDEAGFGTRAGVVVSAVTLIGELGNQYGVKIPYFWGGGHAGVISTFASGNWGSSACHTYANNQNYNYCGLDCSGFVPWAIYNGGYNRNTALLAGVFYKTYPGAERVTLKSNLAVLEPGDLLESKQHITLVVDVDEVARQYVVAHASGNQTGILFSRFSFDQAGYWGVKMDGYYNNPANIRSR